jgi:solute carrier family 34 (sodium-dependent phosphate cotransporter)
LFFLNQNPLYKKAKKKTSHGRKHPEEEEVELGEVASKLERAGYLKQSATSTVSKPTQEKALVHELSSDEDDDDDSDDEEEYVETTWGDIYQSCCIHSAEEWGQILLSLLGVAFFLYFFLFALELMGSSAKVLTGCKTGALFNDNTNPIAGVMVGILATALIHSSSTVTSIIVSLVGSGVSVRIAVYMVMGANIGTTVTCAIVALGQIQDSDQFERAFAGATTHGMFNMMTVAVLLPLEAAVGYLEAITKFCVRHANTKGDGEVWGGPIKKYISPLAERVMIGNKKLINAVAKGEGSCDDGGGFYPIACEGSPSYENCKAGLIACNTRTGKCPAFFAADASASDDKVSGGIVFFISFVILFVCLVGIIIILQRMIIGVSARIIFKATNFNGYFAILIGCGTTAIIQSSSVFTSTLTPIAGIGALPLEQMYALVLGSNIGTTLTAIMAAMVTDGTDPLRVALSHLFFNVTGVAMFYPIPYMRFPLFSARQLGKATRHWKGFPVTYVVGIYYLGPIIILGISSLFQKKSKGFVVLGAFLTFVLAFVLLWYVYWFFRRNGREQLIAGIEQREKRKAALATLPEDMAYLKAAVDELMLHTGYEHGNDLERSGGKGGHHHDDGGMDNVSEMSFEQSRKVLLDIPMSIGK